MSIASRRSSNTKVEFEIRQNTTIILLRENIRKFSSAFRGFNTSYIGFISS